MGERLINAVHVASREVPRASINSLPNTMLPPLTVVSAAPELTNKETICHVVLDKSISVVVARACSDAQPHHGGKGQRLPHAARTRVCRMAA